MNKMNIEVMEQLLKDLAANVGYELIPNPFDTPFEEASIEGLPDSKQFFWPVPSSVLNDKEHEEFRKMCVEADIIDTVCTTSFPWPSDENAHVAILLIDVTRRRRGSIKFVHADEWDISKDTHMAGVCNMLIHDLFPGEHLLAFQMNEDQMDIWLDEPWSHQVCVCAACDVDSLLPKDYLYEAGIPDNDTEEVCLASEVFDIRYPISAKDIAELKETAILLSTTGLLRPQLVTPGEDVSSLDDKMLLVPETGYNVDFAVTLQQLTKEDVLRQLPISRRITVSDMWRLKLNRIGLFDISEEERDKSIEEFLHSYTSK
jgi:hypothetical protein